MLWLDNFDAVFYEQEELRAIRTRRWSYFKYFPGSNKYKFEDELYDLAYDPGEDNNIASDPANADLIAELGGRIDTFFSEYSSPEYNLWDGGMAMAYYYPPVQASIWRDAFGEEWGPQYPADAV